MMKPVSLQDAIKTAALAKRSKVEAGTWKAPVVKQVKVTAQDMKAVKAAESKGKSMNNMSFDPAPILQQMHELRTQVQTLQQQGGGGSPSTPTTDSSSAAIDSLRTQLQEEQATTKALQQDVRELQQALREIRASQSSINASTCSSDNTNDTDLRTALAACRNELATTKGQLESLKDAYESHTRYAATHVDLETVRSELATLRSDKRSGTPGRQRLSDETALPKLDTKSPARKKSITKVSATALLESQQRSKSPSPKVRESKKESKKEPLTKESKKKKLNLKPHAVDTLAEAQRKDKALKEFLKSNGVAGLPFAYSSLSIQDMDDTTTGTTRHIVLFSKRVYIPAKLRTQTLTYLLEHHPYDAQTVLEQRCIWPDCVDEMNAYKISQRKAAVENGITKY